MVVCGGRGRESAGRSVKRFNESGSRSSLPRLVGHEGWAEDVRMKESAECVHEAGGSSLLPSR